MVPNWVIRDALYAGGYNVELWFADGLHAVVDLEAELTGGVFEPLKDIEYFQQVKFSDELGTIYWPNQAGASHPNIYTNSPATAPAPSATTAGPRVGVRN